MHKLPLDVETLRVESFTTGQAESAEAVPANAFTTGLNCPETNFRSCPRPSLCNLC